MRCRICLILCLLVWAPVAALANSDDPGFDVPAMQRDIAVFAGVLRGGLELDARPGLPGARGAGVSGYYLVGQGVVMQLNTPLRSRRGSMGLLGLQDALQSDIDALAELRRGLPRPDADAMRSRMALSLRGDPDTAEDAPAAAADTDEAAQAATEQWAQARARSEALRARHQAEWQQQVTAFEQRLFDLLCDYGASLRLLPDDQYLTLVLSGLGGEDPARREDRLHVLSRESLLQCQRGEIDAAGLQQLALSYAM